MFEHQFRRLISRRLKTLRDGYIAISDPLGEFGLGDANAALSVKVRVNDLRFYRRLAMGGGIGVAESLADGDWSCSNLTDLVRILIRNLPTGDSANGTMSFARNSSEKFFHFLRRNTIGNAKQNIVKHYDLSNEFFALFLDETMSYSSGIFLGPESTLKEASIEKIDRACRKLSLGIDHHLLEIGSGWGALSIHAAKNYGCRVTTTTISDQQFALAKERIEAAGLTGRIELLREDYRKLCGKYDRLVSIEMIEAVGHQYFETFFEKCSQLLKPNGEMLVQAITIADHRFEHHKRTVDFIKRFIFPGGCLPSVTALSQAMAASSRLRMVQMEDFAEHYAETLRRWRAAFLNRVEEVRQLGFDERFIRIWDYYFCYCEAAFMERHVNVSQLLFANHAAKTCLVNQEPVFDCLYDLVEWKRKDDWMETDRRFSTMDPPNPPLQKEGDDPALVDVAAVECRELSR